MIPADKLNAPDSILLLLDRLVEAFRQVLVENLVGFYLHGSLVMGCFNPRRSDIDFIVVVREKLDTPTQKAIIQFILELAPDAPSKGLEFSVVTLDAAQHFGHPTPYELHYSPGWHEVYQSGQVDFEAAHEDPDLAAHFTIIRERGLCVFGRPIDEVFGAVPAAAYWASIRADAEDILNHFDANPVYSILNLCRVVAYKQDGLITSKVEGGQWALDHLEAAYHPLIRQALEEYEADTPDKATWDPNRLDQFAAALKPLL